jgi:transcription termination factor Rho
MELLMNIAELETKVLSDLHEMAKELSIPNFARMRKQDLIIKLMHMQTEQAGNIFSSGILDIVSDGFGFLRSERMLPGPDDVYVAVTDPTFRIAHWRSGRRTGSPAKGK